MDNQKIYKTFEIIVKAVLAIAALWLCISCTMSMSISKNNKRRASSESRAGKTSHCSSSHNCMIFSFNIRFLIFIWASGRAFRLKHIRFAHTRLQSLTRFTPLRNAFRRRPRRQSGVRSPELTSYKFFLISQDVQR
jgi:hypothetical protein